MGIDFTQWTTKHDAMCFISSFFYCVLYVCVDILTHLFLADSYQLNELDLSVCA